MEKISRKYYLLSLVAGFVCFAIAAIIGLQMRQNFNLNELWGQRVLWFWVFIWSGILLTFGHYITTLPQKYKLLGASLLSGVLLAGGFMPMPTFFLMFIAFVPLLWAENVVATERKGTSSWTVFKLAFCAFLTWNILSTWWIQNSSFAAGMFGNTLNAIFMCVPLVLYHITKKRMSQRAAIWGFIGYWMTFEIGHLNWDLSWPWLTLGNSFAHLPSVIQWYEYTGVFGGSFWILAVNIYLANKIIEQDTLAFNHLKQPIIVSSVAVLVPIGISLGIYFSYDVKQGDAAEVVSVQPNYEPHYEKFYINRNTQMKQYDRLSSEMLTENTAYLLFPETAFNSVEISDLSNHPLIQYYKKFIAPYPNLNLIMGLSSYKEYAENEDKPEHLFTYCNENQTVCRYIDSHNSAIQLSNSSEEIPYYKKSKLVPGAESMPFIGDISFFKNLILDMGGAPGLRLGIQDEREAFESETGVVAPLICYESIYGDYVTDYIKKGAQALFVITNDGWWDNTIGHRQHMHLSRLRAVETRKYVVRSANTGISCFINSRGDVYQQSEYDEPIALRDVIYLNTKDTFYVRYGDLIGRVSILITLWLLATMLANGLRREKENDVF